MCVFISSGSVWLLEYVAIMCYRYVDRYFKSTVVYVKLQPDLLLTFIHFEFSADSPEILLS